MSFLKAEPMPPEAEASSAVCNGDMPEDKDDQITIGTHDVNMILIIIIIAISPEKRRFLLFV